MKERPIVFSGPMIRALLSGQKTQTRRLLRSQPKGQLTPWTNAAEPGEVWMDGRVPVRCVESRGRNKRDAGELSLRPVECPYGVPGDRLWVRETIKATPGPPRSGEWRISYAADGVGINLRRERPAAGDRRLRYGMSRQTIPSIHMPRWASRLTLEVTEVRVQRLQDITPEDARAEGVTTECEAKSGDYHGDQTAHLTHDVACHREAFERLWDSINAKRAPWDSNPWVWCVSFRRVA